MNKIVGFWALDELLDLLPPTEVHKYAENPCLQAEQ